MRALVTRSEPRQPVLLALSLPPPPPLREYWSKWCACTRGNKYRMCAMRGGASTQQHFISRTTSRGEGACG